MIVLCGQVSAAYKRRATRATPSFDGALSVSCGLVTAFMNLFFAEATFHCRIRRGHGNIGIASRKQRGSITMTSRASMRWVSRAVLGGALGLTALGAVPVALGVLPAAVPSVQAGAIWTVFDPNSAGEESPAGPEFVSRAGAVWT